MGIFGNSSPFDQDVERATSENSTSEEWGLIMEICDRAGGGGGTGGGAGAARECLRAVMRRLGHADPHVQVHAATLLDACVNNCGRVFHLEVASREFEAEFRRVLARAQPAVQAKLRNMLRKWAEGEFRSDPALDLIPTLHARLNAPSPSLTPLPSPASSTAAAAVAAQREQDELARAIALSLRETSASSAGGAGGGGGAGGVAAAGGGGGQVGLYPRVDASPPPPKKVRALYDFEAAEDNELTFLAGEIVEVTDSSDPNWWKGHNARGEGLFPANFVTADLCDPPEPTKSDRGSGSKSVQFADAAGGAGGGAGGSADGARGVSGGAGGVGGGATRIDEASMDAALGMLHDANPEAAGDERELRALEEHVHHMGNLVDGALERADRRHARLTALSAELVSALNLYHELMRDPRPAGHPAPHPAVHPAGHPAPHPAVHPAGHPAAQHHMYRRC